jgi:hypothetical protein
LTAAERQARARQARQAEAIGLQGVITALRTALVQISDRTSERLPTKADLVAAIDDIGVLAADALTVRETDRE